MERETTPRGELLSVVVPVYDEAAVIEDSLARLAAHLTALGAAFELVCVDDGSRDGTAQALERAARRDARLRVIRCERNRGKGAAVRAGVLAAAGQRVLFTDADLSTDLGATEALLAALEARAPVVFGSRRAPGAVLERPQGLFRRTLGCVFSGLAARAARLPVRDVTCGFKGFTRAAARDLFARLQVEGWAFDAELLAIAGARGWPVAELGVRWRDAGHSKVRVVPAVLRSLADLAAIAVRRRNGAYGGPHPVEARPAPAGGGHG